MKLYELSTIFARLQDELESGDPDQASTALAKVDIIGDALTEKATQMGLLIRNMEAFADAVETEAQHMAARAKAAKVRIAAIKEYLRSNLTTAGVTKIECPQFKISLRDNPPRVNIVDVSAIPPEYMRTPEPPPAEPDKKKILDDWKQHGVVLEGVEITIGNRVEIK